MKFKYRNLSKSLICSLMPMLVVTGVCSCKSSYDDMQTGRDWAQLRVDTLISNRDRMNLR